MAVRITAQELTKAIKRYRGEPAYAPGQEINGKLICGAKKKTSDPCGSSPVPGGTRCGRHGGNSPKAKAAATQRMAEQEAREILGHIDPTAPRENPAEMLLNLIHGKSAEISWLRRKVKAQTDEALVYGLTERQEGIGPQGPVDMTTHKVEQNIWWKLLREAENQLASWTSMALRAGVEERRVRIAEQQGNLIAQAIQTILDGLQLTPTQAKLIPQIVPAALRELTED